ncbi:MAG: hypothetical protein JSW54_02445 [Fidelibacterota bacterium]|nr:MAG: hypothetical protein JSW54_02445 [Candidatus Neomarinimicrobiota bacterium]
MFRSGKYQRLIAVFLVLGWCLALTTPARANLRFFSIVQQVCKSYRVPVTLDQMSMEGEEGTNPTFNIALQSRRNNFEEVMLVGYIASSQAIARTDMEVKTINITVTIPKADNMLLMTTADIALVEQLRLGEIKSSEFMRQLQWN